MNTKFKRQPRNKEKTIRKTIREFIVLARNWLQSKVKDINHFKPFKMDKHPQCIDGKFKEKDFTYKKIADFLSKNGKVVSYVTVKKSIIKRILT